VLDIPSVALISEEFPPYMFGGIGSVCHDLAYSLAQRKVQTTVLCGRSRRVAVEKTNDYLRVVRVPFLDFPPRFLWFQLQNMRRSLRFLSNCAVLHAVSPASATIWTYLKKRINSPLVSSVHGTPREGLEAFLSFPVSWWSLGDFGFHVLEYPVHRSLFWTTLRGSDHICVCSSTVLHNVNVYGHFSPDKISLIYNGVNFDYIDSVKNEAAEDHGECSPAHTVLYSGRLFGPKGIMHMITAFYRLQKQIADVNLKIFGSGPLEERAKKLVSELGMKDRVCFGGFVPRRKLLAEVKSCDVVVLPSLVEAQPMSALEAMACRKPLVAFDMPYVREFLTDDYNAFLVPRGNVDDLCDRILTLLLDKKLRVRIGQNAYRYVKANHNWNSLVDKYLEVYEKVTGMKRGR